MKQFLKSLSAGMLFTVLITGAVLAGDPVVKEKIQVQVVAEGGEVIDADLSGLAIGESRSFVTENGKTIDVLRSADGVELYIDGELQSLGFGADGVHEDHKIMHKTVNVECTSDDEGACDQDYVFVNADGDYDFETADGVVIIDKRIEIECDEETGCEEMVWISEDGEDVHFEGTHAKVIRIHEKVEED